MEKKLEGKMRVPRKLASAVAVAALAAALTPAAALAAPAEKAYDTDVKLYNDSGQVTVVVPTTIPAAVASSNGSFVTATTPAKFQNEGVFDVHVAKIGVKAGTGVNLVAESAFAADSTPNTVWAAVQPGAGTKVDLASHVTPQAPSAASQWNIKGGSELEINLEGAMKNAGNAFVTADNPTTAPVAFTITWTVAAGAAS